VDSRARETGRSLFLISHLLLVTLVAFHHFFFVQDAMSLVKSLVPNFVLFFYIFVLFFSDLGYSLQLSNFIVAFRSFLYLT